MFEEDNVSGAFTGARTAEDYISRLTKKSKKIPVKTYDQLQSGTGAPFYTLNSEEAGRFMDCVKTETVSKGDEIKMCKLGNNSLTCVYGGSNGNLTHIEEDDVCFILTGKKSPSGRNSPKKEKEPIIKESYGTPKFDLYR